MGEHQYAGHTHGIRVDADERKLAVALALIVGFMAVEIVVGIVVSSLALLSDAAHMLTDAGAIALALVAMRLARRPAKGAMTYGLGRAEILSAQFNGSTLLVLSFLIVYEGIRRLVEAPDVPGTPLLVVALVGVGVNLTATWTLSKANRQSLNVEGAFQHIVTDLAAFIATAIAGVVILATGFTRADGIAALIVSALMLRAAYGFFPGEHDWWRPIRRLADVVVRAAAHPTRPIRADTKQTHHPDHETSPPALSHSTKAWALQDKPASHVPSCDPSSPLLFSFASRRSPVRIRHAPFRLPASRASGVNSAIRALAFTGKEARERSEPTLSLLVPREHPSFLRDASIRA